jgi:hypothetical protein
LEWKPESSEDKASQKAGEKASAKRKGDLSESAE